MKSQEQLCTLRPSGSIRHRLEALWATPAASLCAPTATLSSLAEAHQRGKLLFPLLCDFTGQEATHLCKMEKWLHLHRVCTERCQMARGPDLIMQSCSKASEMIENVVWDGHLRVTFRTDTELDGHIVDRNTASLQKGNNLCKHNLGWKKYG